MKNYKLAALVLGFLVSMQSFAQAQDAAAIYCMDASEEILIEASIPNSDADTYFVLYEGENKIVMDFIGTETNPASMMTKNTYLEVIGMSETDPRAFIFGFSNDGDDSESNVTLLVFDNIQDQVPSKTYNLYCESAEYK